MILFAIDPVDRIMGEIEATVVCPAYNEAETIEDMIRSVLKCF